MTTQQAHAAHACALWQMTVGARASGSGGAAFQQAVQRATWRADGAQAIDAALDGNVPNTSSVSLEDMLRQTHPRLAYHVFDATSPNWKRNDYPHYLLYQQGVDTSRLENWQPKGAEPDQLHCPATRALLDVPEGLVAVVIHPDCQKAMDADPEYARRIYDRIEAWFAFDELRNAGALGGQSGIFCRAIAIGADGGIANVQAFGGGPSGARGASAAADEDEYGRLSWWDKRALRHAKHMREWTERQMEHARLASEQLVQMSVATDAKMKLRRLMADKDLSGRLGGTVAGADTAKILQATAQAVFGGSLSALSR